MPKVSVIMASYNHEAYVRAAIASVLEQSFQDFEILVTDDGSTDRTSDEVRSVKDARVSLVSLPRNYGACIAMNASINRAKGEYIAVLNSDDLFLPGKLEKQVAYLDAHPETGAVFAYPQFVNDEGGVIPDAETFYRNTFRAENRSRAQWLRHFFFNHNVLCHPSLLIRKRCYKMVGLYDPGLAQLPDLHMWIRVLSRFHIHILKEPLLGFRILTNYKNASAPRPEVLVRLEWERRRVLEEYSKLDAKILYEAFPELGPDLRTRVPKWLASVARRVLHSYLARSDVRADPVSEWDAQPTPIGWKLALLALQVGRPAHVAFALDLMRRTLHDMEDDSRYREMIEWSGKFDPFGMLYRLPMNRSIAAIGRE